MDEAWIKGDEMTTKEISGFLSTGLCLVVFLTVGLLGIGVAEQSYYSLYSNNAPQTPQDREDLFKALRNFDDKGIPQAMLYAADTYKALQNPYAFNDPQAALEQANTLKEIQNLNGAYYSSRTEDNWDYWANMWLNGPQEATGTAFIVNGYGVVLDTANPYMALQNPYALNDPQAALEQANTLKEIQKLNGAYYSSRTEDNWDYWANMWLNGPQT